MKEREAYRKHDVPEDYVRNWQETMNVLARTFDVPAALIMRVLADEIEVLVRSESEGNPYEPGEKAKLNAGFYCETVMKTGAPLHVPNALEDPQWQDNPDIKLNMISYLGMPLVWPDGSVFGTVCVLDQQSQQYDADYMQLLEQFRKIIEQDFDLLERKRELQETLDELQEAHADIQEANRRMRHDLVAACDMQQALLPKQAPAADKVKLRWAYHPSDELGGDMLNVFPLGNDKIGLFMLDVTGHGVPAALLSVTVARDLWPYAGHQLADADPASAGLETGLVNRIAALNKTIAMEATAGRFLTLLYGVLDVRSRRFRFVNAAHPFPILMRNGAFEEIGVPGLPIGVQADAEYEETEISVQPGDRIYVYSDGLVEEPDSAGDLFGLPRLQEAIFQARALPLEKSIDAVMDAVLAWSEHGKLRDDASIVAFEVM